MPMDRESTAWSDQYVIPAKAGIHKTLNLSIPPRESGISELHSPSGMTATSIAKNVVIPAPD